MIQQMTMHTKIMPLPQTCIRGPELTSCEQIGAEIRAVDEATLQAYQQGLELIITIHTLQQDAVRLEELKQTRAFLVGQLELMEREHPRAFDRARAAFDQGDDLLIAASADIDVCTEVEPCTDSADT